MTETDTYISMYYRFDATTQKRNSRLNVIGYEGIDCTLTSVAILT